MAAWSRPRLGAQPSIDVLGCGNWNEGLRSTKCANERMDVGEMEVDAVDANRK